MDQAPGDVGEALDLLMREGYGIDVTVTAAGVKWALCGHSHSGSEVVAERVFRFEGTSDPDDESIVFGVVCPTCGARGSIVSAYGPGADPDVLDQITMIRHG